MKKNGKRMIALSMAAWMAAGALAGCSAGKGSESGTNAGTQGNQTSETEGKKGVTLTFGSHQSGLPTTGIVQDLAKELKRKQGLRLIFRFHLTPSGEI